MATNITSRSLVLTWIEPQGNNAPITGYRVMYSEPTFLGSNMIVLNVTEERANIIQLHPGVIYEFTVVGFNDIGNSAPSEVFSQITDEEGTFHYSIDYLLYVSAFYIYEYYLL